MFTDVFSWLLGNLVAVHHRSDVGLNAVVVGLLQGTRHLLYKVHGDSACILAILDRYNLLLLQSKW